MTNIDGIAVNPRTIKLIRAKIQSRVDKEIADIKKAQNVRKRLASRQKADEENEVQKVKSVSVR